MLHRQSDEDSERLQKELGKYYKELKAHTELQDSEATIKTNIIVAITEQSRIVVVREG